MLRITVEYLPGGSESRKETIATVDVSNVSNLAPVSSYEVVARVEKMPEQRFMVRGHERAYGWRALVVRAFEGVAIRMAPRG